MSKDAYQLVKGEEASKGASDEAPEGDPQGSMRKDAPGGRKSGVRLPRSLRLHHGVAVICGLIIGSGIYVSPGGVMDSAGSPGAGLVVWVVAGVIATLGALCFAELGTTFPAGGEKYEYLARMYGDYVSFLYMWMYLMMLRPSANAIKCLVFGRYLLQPLYTDCDAPHGAIILIACCVTAAMCFINCMSVKYSARGQTLMVTLSISALIIITVTAFVLMLQGKTPALDISFTGTSKDPTDIVLAIYSATFSYLGWNALNFLVEELKNPIRNLPLAILISMVMVIGLYLLVNVAYLLVIGMDRMISSQAVAVTFGQEALGPAAWVMSLFIAVSVAGSFNSGVLVGSRLSFVAARNGHLPDILAGVSITTAAPVCSVIFQFVQIFIFANLLDIETMITNNIAASTLADLVNIAGLIYLRWKKPELKRPIKMPMFVHALYLACMVLMVGIPMVSRPRSTGTGMLLVLLTGTPVYLLFVRWSPKPRGVNSAYGAFRTFVQKLLLCVPQAKQD